MIDSLLWHVFEEREFDIADEPHYKKGTISRDSDYQLSIKIFGRIPDDAKLPDPDISMTLLQTKEVIRGFSTPPQIGWAYTLSGVRFTHERLSADRTIELTGLAYEFVEEFKLAQAPPAEVTIYWFLNGTSDFWFPQDFEMDVTETAKVKFGEFIQTEIISSHERSFGHNLIPLSFKGCGFVFGQARKELSGHEKCSFIQCRHNALLGPSDIEELRPLLSWVIGAELIGVGASSFSSKWSLVRRVFLSTERKDVARTVASHNMPFLPVRMNDYFALNKEPTSVINRFLEAFSRLKETYSLEKVIWYINYSRTQSIRTSIQPLAAAFDLLCNAFYRDSASRQILPREEFLPLLEQLSNELNARGRKDDRYQELVRNLRNINLRTVSQKNMMIFEEVGLQIGEAESKALHERHIAVHGSSESRDPSELLTHGQVFYTLVCRLLLRLLDLDTPYIDYSMKGKVLTPLSMPQQRSGAP